MSKSNPEAGLSAPRTGLRPYLITAAAIAICYVLFSLLLHLGESAVRALMLAGMSACGVLAFLRLRPKGADRMQTLIVILIAAGIVMRIGYMLYTSFRARGHDIGAFDQTGHFAYMYRLFSDGALPQSNEYQFYHPPFAHIVQALVVKVFSWFQPGAQVDALFEAAKIVPCFASCAVLWVCRSICRETKLSSRATALALAVLAFHPTFYIFASSVNNDPLMLLCFMIAVLYTIRWYYAPTMKHILFTALAIGLGMMTKLSAAAVALFTAPVFLAVLVKAFREKKPGHIIGQFAAFAGVCAPLGLWYPIRNYIKFGQAFGHVYTLSRESKLYSGGYSFAQRFLSFPVDQTLSPLYCQPYGDYNLWLYTLKCSVFGEFSFEQAEWMGALLIAANLALILVSLAAMVYVMCCCRETNKFARFGLFWLWLVQIGSFIVFNVGFPFGCTMDFRYIVPTAIIGAIYTGIALDHLKGRGKALPHILFYMGVAVIALFGIASVLFYAA
jgi:4-amino-4-deoxy-L-arabinose transferase-like glycosyltransferase